MLGNINGLPMSTEAGRIHMPGLSAERPKPLFLLHSIPMTTMKVLRTVTFLACASWPAQAPAKR